MKAAITGQGHARRSSVHHLGSHRAREGRFANRHHPGDRRRLRHRRGHAPVGQSRTLWSGAGKSASCRRRRWPAARQDTASAATICADPSTSPRSRVLAAVNVRVAPSYDVVEGFFAKLTRRRLKRGVFRDRDRPSRRRVWGPDRRLGSVPSSTSRPPSTRSLRETTRTISSPVCKLAYVEPYSLVQRTLCFDLLNSEAASPKSPIAVHSFHSLDVSKHS